MEAQQAVDAERAALSLSEAALAAHGAVVAEAEQRLAAEARPCNPI